jgi:hypothetical protein
LTLVSSTARRRPLQFGPSAGNLSFKPRRFPLERQDLRHCNKILLCEFLEGRQLLVGEYELLFI